MPLYRLTGTIPPALASAVYLQSLTLSNNKLTGTIGEEVTLFVMHPHFASVYIAFARAPVSNCSRLFALLTMDYCRLSTRRAQAFYLPALKLLMVKILQSTYNRLLYMCTRRPQVFYLPALERLVADGNDFTGLTHNVM